MKHGIMLLQNSTLPPRTKDFNGSLQQGIHHFHRFVNLISPSITRCYLESKGWRSGESTCLPPMWLGFKSQRRRHMWVEFVVGSLLCSERFFFPGAPVFPSLQKPTFSNSNSTRNQVDEEALCGCATSKSLLINYLFIHSFICYNRSLIENRQ